MVKSFSAQIESWNDLTFRQTTDVFKQSAQEVLRDAQENVRVDTGFLKNSMYSGLNGDTSAEGPSKGKPDVDYTTRKNEDYVLTIAGSELGDSITGGWSAEYSLAREEKDAFLASAAQNWQQIVYKNANKIKR